jgi:hypothetical protein
MREKRRFLVFGQPLVEESDIKEVVASLQAVWPGTGPKVLRFEKPVRSNQDSTSSRTQSLSTECSDKHQQLLVKPNRLIDALAEWIANLEIL